MKTRGAVIRQSPGKSETTDADRTSNEPRVALIFRFITSHSQIRYQKIETRNNV